MRDGFYSITSKLRPSLSKTYEKISVHVYFVQKEEGEGKSKSICATRVLLLAHCQVEEIWFVRANIRKGRKERECAEHR